MKRIILSALMNLMIISCGLGAISPKAEQDMIRHFDQSSRTLFSAALRLILKSLPASMRCPIHRRL